ncbi:MAG: sigma-70 family RNA polymerase sigma factor [Planctomycetes bacterium]|nr:sigma-70 family RNA polymerase sigma factor [Planctomycetota bacterium]
MSSPIPSDPARDARPSRPSHLDELFDLTYAELHRIARGLLRSPTSGGTHQATSLMHEAFVRMASRSEGWNDREHFVRSIACAMRRILVDHARARAARGVRRDGGSELDALVAGVEAVSGDLVRLDEALEALGRLDPDAVRIVELRYFASLSVEECAAALGISTRQVERELQFARGWLRGRLS